MKFGAAFLDLISHYVPIIIGTVLGTLAHFGRMISAKEILSMAEVIGFFLQLGFIALLSTWVTRYMEIVDRDSRAMVAAIFALSAHEVIQFIKRKGWRAIASSAGVDTDKKD